jgi:hypothetical protein
MQKQLEEKTEQLNKLQQKMGTITMAKTKQQLDSAFRPEEIDMIFKDYEKFDEQVRNEREALNNLKIINIDMQQQIKAARH